MEECMAVLSQSPQVRAGTRVTIIYVSVFVISVFAQVYGKVFAILAHKKAKTEKDTKPVEKFNRYETKNLTLLISDRVVGNFIEWAVPFLSTFWLSILLTGEGENLGYAYSGFRLLYLVVAFNGGIRFSGAHPIIFLATVPMYYIIVKLSWNTAQVVFY